MPQGASLRGGKHGISVTDSHEIFVFFETPGRFRHDIVLTDLGEKAGTLSYGKRNGQDRPRSLDRLDIGGSLSHGRQLC